MDKNILLKLADSLNTTASAVKEVANSLAEEKVEPAFQEKVRLIVEKLGVKRAAQRLDIDSSTLIRWRNGGPSLRKNRLKVEALYNELYH